MSKYIIVKEHKDQFTNESSMTIVEEFSTRVDAVKFAKFMPEGEYTLMSILRRGFKVGQSQKIVRTMVDWGQTLQPRTRKVKVEGSTKAKAKSTRKATPAIMNGEDTAHVNN